MAAGDVKKALLEALTGADIEASKAKRIVDALYADGGAMDKASRGIDNATQALTKYNRALNESNDSVKNFAGAIDSGLGSIGDFTSSITQLGAYALGPLGGMLKGFGQLAEVGFKIAGKSVDVFTKKLTGTLETVDDFTMFHRKLDKANFDLAKSFGGSFEEAQSYTDQFVRNLKSYASIDYGFLSREELDRSIKSFENLNISTEKIFSTVRLGSRDMELYAAAVLQAGAMNMETYQYLDKLENLMSKQGMTAQQAVEQMAMFSDVAKETGLNVDTVVSTLTGAISSFTKLGMTADFGRPLLEGLTRTLDDMGLGIENATGLTGELSGALGKLTTDYATAYITQQRSGIDFGGGGGVLGASIGLQAQMLQAEKTGDQAGMAQMLTGAMKDTLTSFTGGDIVTVEEAAQDPSRQMAFYSQQQLLGSQFGISDQQSAVRVLDYLDQLEQATASGDKEAAAILEKQIDEEVKGRDKTLGEMEKMNRQFNALLAYTKVNTRNLTITAQGIGAGIATGGTEAAGDMLGVIGTKLEQLDKQADAYIESGNLAKTQNLLADPSKIGDIIMSSIRDGQINTDSLSTTFDRSERTLDINRGTARTETVDGQQVKMHGVIEVIVKQDDGREVGRGTTDALLTPIE